MYICVSFQSEQMAADAGALPRRRSPPSRRRAGLPIRDFTAWQPVEWCDLQGSVRSAALRLTPHSSLFSCQGCRTHHSSGEELHDTAADIKRRILNYSCTLWGFFCACTTACLFKRHIKILNIVVLAMHTLSHKEAEHISLSFIMKN